MSEQTNHQQVHEILARNFTDRYLEKSGFDKLAYSQPYDPENSLCDYERTSWPATPDALRGLSIGKFILRKTHHLTSRQFDEFTADPFYANAQAISEAAKEYPLLLVNGHEPDLQAALSLVLNGIALAHYDHDLNLGNVGTNFEKNALISHAVGTRGFAPIIVGKPWLPKPKRSLVDISRWVMNPHLSFPDNKRMRESELPASFRSDYNELFKAELRAAIPDEPTHPYGYHEIVSTPPSGTRDLRFKDADGKRVDVMPTVSNGTIEMIKDMKCGLVPVYAHFGGKGEPSFMKLHGIMPPDDVSAQNIHSIMTDIAHFRAEKSGRQIHYERDVNEPLTEYADGE
jgi:hypothetical protein